MQQLLQAGASGYVLKQSKSVELLRAIRAVGLGQTYLDPAIAEKAVTQIRSGKRAARGVPSNANLSDREEEVLRLIAWGHINKEVAARLNVSVKTIEVHKANAMRKMGMKKPRRHRALRDTARLAARHLMLSHIHFPISKLGKNPYYFTNLPNTKDSPLKLKQYHSSTGVKVLRKTGENAFNDDLFHSLNERRNTEEHGRGDGKGWS